MEKKIRNAIWKKTSRRCHFEICEKWLEKPILIKQFAQNIFIQSKSIDKQWQCLNYSDFKSMESNGLINLLLLFFFICSFHLNSKKLKIRCVFSTLVFLYVRFFSHEIHNRNSTKSDILMAPTHKFLEMNIKNAHFLIWTHKINENWHKTAWLLCVNIILWVAFSYLYS